VPYSVRYKRAASAELEAAIVRYAQPEINRASALVKDIERTEAHLRAQPALYQQVEGEIPGLYCAVSRMPCSM
jgi:hypothetical protein